MTAGLRATSPADVRPRARNQRRWLNFGTLAAAIALNGLADSLGPDAAAAIQQQLEIEAAAMPVILFGYTLVFIFVLLPAARLGDIVGRKRMFLGGVGGCLVAALLCAVAPNAGMLTAGRLLQGAAAAVVISQVLSLIMADFPPYQQSQRIAGFALYGIVVAFIAPSAPMVDDAVWRADLLGLGWRGVFLVIAVVSLLLFGAAVRTVRDSKADLPVRFDVGGTLLCLLALLLFVWPLSSGGGMGWPSWIFVPLGLSVLATVLLVMRQRRKERVGGTPLIVPDLFREPAFSRGMVVIAVMSFAILGFFPTLTTYLQEDFGFAVGEVWLASLGWPVGILITSVSEIWLAPRHKRGLLVLGASVMTSGIVGLIPVFMQAATAVTWWQISSVLLVAGLGKGLLTPALIDLVLARVRYRDIGSASGSLLVTQQLGGLAGFAFLGAVLAGVAQGLVFESAALVAVTLLVFLLPRAGPQQARGVTEHSLEASQ